MYQFIYSGSARLVSFEIKLISKEVSRAEPEYMNIHPPIRVLATALSLTKLARDYSICFKGSKRLFHSLLYVVVMFELS